MYFLNDFQALQTPYRDACMGTRHDTLLQSNLSKYSNMTVSKKQENGFSKMSAIAVEGLIINIRASL